MPPPIRDMKWYFPTLWNFRLWKITMNIFNSVYFTQFYIPLTLTSVQYTVDQFLSCPSKNKILHHAPLILSVKKWHKYPSTRIHKHKNWLIIVPPSVCICHPYIGTAIFFTSLITFLKHQFLLKNQIMLCLSHTH